MVTKEKRAEWARIWRSKNKDKTKEYEKKRDKDKRKIRAKLAREKNREKLRIAAKEYYRKNRERCIEYAVRKYWSDPKTKNEHDKERRKRLGYKEKEREKYRRDPSKKIESAKRWYTNNKEKCKERSMQYRARKFSAHGHVKKSDYDKLVLLLGDRCLNCGSTSRVQWDHVIPLSVGGCHQPTNIQPLCCSCNPSKGNRSRKDYRTKKQIKQVMEAFQLKLFRKESKQ